MLLLLLALAGDQQRDKYEVLYITHGKVLFAIGWGILKDEHLAGDALQECFLKVFLNMDRIEEIDSSRTRAYLATIMKSCATDLYRKEKKRRDVTEWDDASLDRIEDDFNVEEILARGELTEALYREIGKLKDLDRNLICLKYFYGYADRELAKLVGLSEGNVRVRLTRAKKRLAEFLTAQKGGDEK